MCSAHAETDMLNFISELMLHSYERVTESIGTVTNTHTSEVCTCLCEVEFFSMSCA